MISTLKIPRVAGTVMLALCGLAFHGAAQAIGIYDATAQLSVKVAGVVGAVDEMYARQSMGFNNTVVQGTGSATNTFTPPSLPSGIIPLITNQTVVTNAVNVLGSAFVELDVTSSDLMTVIRVWLIGPESQQGNTVVTLNYDFSGLATSNKYGTANVLFRLLDNSLNLLDERMYGTGSALGDGGDYSASLPVSVAVGQTVVMRFEVRAFGTAVPTPAPLALIAGGLLAMGASRRWAGARQGS